ncbi:MAG: sulfatase-like hydrolase/transferase, partial [Bacteroidales bacterium]
MNKKIINQEFEIVIKLFFFLLIIVSYSCSGGKAIKEKPNILLILSDDQGFCELGAYMDFADPSTLAAWRIDEWKNVTRRTPTIAPIEVCFEAARKCMPNVDRIASEGVRFTSFYTAATCAPSRAALMTGCYPQRYGICSNGDVKNKRAGGLSTDATVAVE